MNIIKKTVLTSVMTLSLVASSVAFAEEEAAATAVAAAPANSVSETIQHVEATMVEVGKSDFAAAQLHVKMAREASAKITGNEAIVKQATQHTIQGQILAKKGESEKSGAELAQALALYKSIQ